MSRWHPENSRSLNVVGAEANNLKNVSVRFPLQKITVVTGVSGSGKSSLLSDTLAAEGSRRTRIFLGTSQKELERDDVGAFVSAIPPTVLVGQRGFRPSVRTTIGTASGFLAALRRLFIHASVPVSVRARADVPPPSPESYAYWIAAHYSGVAEVWAVPVRDQKTNGVLAVKRLASLGVERATVFSKTDTTSRREKGRVIETRSFKGLNADVPRTVEALIGALRISKASGAAMLLELLELAFKAAGSGAVVVMLPASSNPGLVGPFGPRLDSNRHWVHPKDPAVYAGPSTHLLSFNAPDHDESGACPACRGTGVSRRLREAALVTHPERAMKDGSFAIWTEKNYKYVNIQHETIRGLQGLRGFSNDTPWSKLPASARSLVLDGSGDELVFDIGPSGKRYGDGRPFPGFRRVILDKASAPTKTAALLDPYVETGTCDVCRGTRWSFQARALRVAGQNIAEFLAMTFSEAEVFTESSAAFRDSVPPGARPLVDAVCRHAHSIVSVGLGYLTGERGMLEVSEGESRRVRLARVLDASESGLCLLFDEPARGLHEADLPRLAIALERLRGKHTVVVNEHREGLWDVADWFVEVGPRAGASGGEITYAGSKPRHEGETDRPLRLSLPPTSNGRKLTLRRASIHNVDGVDCEIPLGRLTCICGVSGSGKSSFVRGVLAPSLLNSVGGTNSDFTLRSGRWDSIRGHELVGELVALDQTAPPLNRRSLVATYTGVFENVRRAFGGSPAAKADGLSASDFGVNSGNGRCQSCLGVGEIENDDVWSNCPACGGSRYGRAVLSVRVDGTNVQELLETAVEGIPIVGNTFGIPHRLVASMCDLGIGYLALGRRLDTLSGGEVQRLRLAMRLSEASTSSAFFILDEPAVGLHRRDVARVAAALHRALHDGQNTMVIVEHDLGLIGAADWIIEFGPGSGPDGGRIIFAGTPEQLVKVRTPTGLAFAGKLPRVKKTRKSTDKHVHGMVRTGPSERERRTRALIGALIGGDTTERIEATSSIDPAVVVSDRFWNGLEEWEVAGLDREIPKLLLDVQRPPRSAVFTELLGKWEKDRKCWLAIQPYLADMQIWGGTIPKSAVRSVSLHVSREGLRFVTNPGESSFQNSDVRHIRATGPRLSPESDSSDARLRVLLDAFAIGGQYVELRREDGRVAAIATDRLVDVERGIVGPMASLPPHFSRLDPRGSCVMCDGTRFVTALAASLVIGNRAVPPDDDRFLTPDAAAIMKGVFRNDLRPFLKRLAVEGLWNLKTPFDRLEREQQEMILFGFWSRPGAGTFLKKPNDDRAVAASWLHWDGLYNYLLDQSPRSKSASWFARLKESVQGRQCIRCNGTGLRPYAKLLRVGDVRFTDWVASGDTDDKVQLLKRVHVFSRRQALTQERIVGCFSDRRKRSESGNSVHIVARAVESFTTMEPIVSDEIDVN